MNSTLEFVLKKFKISYKKNYALPIIIRNFGRDQLAEMFCDLGFSVGVEIGVERGLYSEVLCKANPKLKLFAIDPYTTYGDYRVHGMQADLMCSEAKIRLSPYKCHLMLATSMEVVNDFKDGSLDFVYIDGNHAFKYVTEDIYEWSKKVRKGGIISGHDWVIMRNNSDEVHVKYVLQGYTEAYRIKPWFVLGAKQADDGEIRDRWRSWMWVKT